MLYDRVLSGELSYIINPHERDELSYLRYEEIIGLDDEFYGSGIEESLRDYFSSQRLLFLSLDIWDKVTLGHATHGTSPVIGDIGELSTSFYSIFIVT